MRVVVVGGGIVGLATGRLLAREHPDADVLVLEKERELASHQTGHNSGVVHAGLYYVPGSLKARLCRRGVTLLRAYCEERGLPYELCGKVVVALREDELGRLDALHERAATNGVPGLRRLDAAGIRAIEPHAAGIAGLHSPETAITDYPAIARSFGDDVQAAGGRVRTGATVVRVTAGSGSKRAVVTLDDGEELPADRVVVCAGLHGDRLARASGEPLEPRIVPFRGEYWQIAPERRNLVKGLIYPVPDPKLPFLGVHLTRKVDGSVWIGPNAIFGLAREGYRRSTFVARDVVDTLSWPGTARLMRRHWRAGLAEIHRTASKRKFLDEARAYVPDLRRGDAVRGPAGVRAQAVDRDGAMVDDFRFGGDGRIVWVRNAPSPGATSSMAIAEEIAARVQLSVPSRG